MVREVYGVHLSVREKGRLKKMIRSGSHQGTDPTEDGRGLDCIPGGSRF